MAPRRLRHLVRTASLAMVVASWLEGTVCLIRAESFDCQIRPMARIPPGTRVSKELPSPWTHLISMGLPRLGPGEAEKLHVRAAELAELLFTVLAARVGTLEEPNGLRYRLEEVAIGLGTRIGQTQVVITSQTQAELGAEFDLVQRYVLAAAEQELDRLIQIAASDTTRIIDMPTNLCSEGRHRPVVLRYAFLVHPNDGRMEVLFWQIDLDEHGAYQPTASCAVRRKLGQVETRLLCVDAHRVWFGIPSSDAFAFVALPSGSAIPLSPTIQPLAARRFLTPQMAEQIDSELRRMIGFLPTQK